MSENVDPTIFCAVVCLSRTAFIVYRYIIEDVFYREKHKPLGNKPGFSWSHCDVKQS